MAEASGDAGVVDMDLVVGCVSLAGDDFYGEITVAVAGMAAHGGAVDGGQSSGGERGAGHFDRIGIVGIRSRGGQGENEGENKHCHRQGEMGFHVDYSFVIKSLCFVRMRLKMSLYR